MSSADDVCYEARIGKKRIPIKHELWRSDRLPKGQGLCIHCGDILPWRVVSDDLPEK